MQSEIMKAIQDFLIAFEIHQKGLKNLCYMSFYDAPEILAKLDFTGTPEDYITKLIGSLSQYGHLASGEHALVRLLKDLQGKVGADNQARIAGLIKGFEESSQSGPDPLSGNGKRETSTYEYDIFVSFAEVDDQQPFGSSAKGWVTTLITNLKTCLNQRLGAPDAYTVWSPHQLPGHVNRIAEIKSVIEKSAIFVIVLSQGYLLSDWCRPEKIDLLGRARKRGLADSRLFIVERDRLESSERPPEFADLPGYRFWIADREGRPPRTLGEPTPERDGRLYYEPLTDLCHDLTQEIRKLKP